MRWELANGRFALMTAAPIGLVQPPREPTYSIEPSEGAPMPTRVNGDRDTSWHPPSSLQRHGLQWMFMPLIAFAIFDFRASSAGPDRLHFEFIGASQLAQRPAAAAARPANAPAAAAHSHARIMALPGALQHHAGQVDRAA